jgi:hypothetical protein
MNVLNAYGLAFGLTIGILAALFSFFNRQRYKTLITEVYQPGNDELRKQLATEKELRIDCEKSSLEWQAKYKEQALVIKRLERLNDKQADFAGLTKLISNNHTEMMSGITDLAKDLAKKGR